MQNYYRDDPNKPLSSNSESFKYKTGITVNTYNVVATIFGNDSNQIPNINCGANKVGKNETEVVIPVKHLSNFWRSLNLPLINCEIELILSWSKNCLLADLTAANNPPTGLEFQITTDTGVRLYVPVVTLSGDNDKKLLQQLKSGFKRTVNGINTDHKVAITV